MAIGDGYVYLMISIHALREEGDDTAAASSRPLSDFYPRPPRGGRHGRCVQLLNQRIISIHALREEGDSITSEDLRCIRISIHALREEGDMAVASSSSTSVSFLSTPSARRATRLPPKISVVYAFLSTPSARRATELTSILILFLEISIHALREEGDREEKGPEVMVDDFYPHPPRGGRHLAELQNIMMRAISIHALREEGDEAHCGSAKLLQAISIHALREEGDSLVLRPVSLARVFLSTPSARRATRGSLTAFLSLLIFLSTPSARRATDFA